MAEANYNDAVTFLRRLNHCLEQGRRAEDFFNLLTTEDALRQKFLGYGTALDVGVVQNIRRGVVEGITKRWLQDSNCCTPDWQRTFMPKMLHGHQQLMMYLDNGTPIPIEDGEKQCDLLGIVSLFKDGDAVVRRLQQVEEQQATLCVGLFRNPEAPLDPSGTQTFRQIVGHIFWEMIWRPRFASKQYTPEAEHAVHQRLLSDVDGIFFQMFDADHSNSIDVMELLVGLIRVFRSFHSYDNHASDPIVRVKRECLSPLFDNLCRASPEIQNIFVSMFQRMHEWDTLRAFIQSLSADYLYQQMKHYALFDAQTLVQLELCCAPFDPSQRALYDQHCAATVRQVAFELSAKLRPFCNVSGLAFFIDRQFEQSFFDARLENAPTLNSEADVLFLFLWKFMDHFLSKSTSLSHFFNDHHVPVVEDLNAIKIQDLETDLDKTKADTRVQHDAVSLKRWFLHDVALHHFPEVCTYNAEMKNFYDYCFNGASLDQFERLLFIVDRANNMADFRPEQKQAELEFYAQKMYDSDLPTFGRSLQKYPGFSFGLDAFERLMKRYFSGNHRDLDSPSFKRSCEVWFRCFGANKSIPKELHDAADGHRQMHLNFKRMLLGLKKARQYLLTGSAEHSFALAFELIDIDGNQVLDFVEIVRWFHSWILYDVWHFGEDPGAILEFYFKSGRFQESNDLPADFRDHLVRFQREGRFFSSSEPSFKEFILFYQSIWSGLFQDLAQYIAVELLNIATAYEFDHARLRHQTISRQDMSCLLLDAPATNRFVHRLPTTQPGMRNIQRVIRTDGSEQKGFGFLLALQNLFKRWLSLHGMWLPIAASNAETVQVQSDFNTEKAQVLSSFVQSGLPSVLIQQFSIIFDNIRNHIATLPGAICDKDNFRYVMVQLMSMQPPLCPQILASKVDSLFVCFDVDGNGSLDVIEIMNGFRTLLSRSQSSLADLAFRFADSSPETNRGPFSGAQNQKLDEDEFQKLISTMLRDEPYVLQVILNKICVQEPPFFESRVTQFSVQSIEQLRFHPALTHVRDFSNPIQNLQQHQALVDALFVDPAGPLLFQAVCRAFLDGRRQKSPQIDQHEFRQLFENNQLFGWAVRFWLLRGFLSEDHPQYNRLSGLAPPRDIQFCDNVEASEAKARLRHQHLAWYFAAFDTTVDDLLGHLQKQYMEITGSASGQINQAQFERLIHSIFSSLGIRDQIDLSALFTVFDADQSGEISRKEIIDGFIQHFHRIETVFHKILAHFELKMNQDQNLTSFCSKYLISVPEFLEKLKSLFIARSTSLANEIDGPGFCALWKQMLIEFGIWQRNDPKIDAEATHHFYVADTSGNGGIDFAELLFFVSEQCVNLLKKSAEEHKKIEDLMRKAADHQERHGTPQVLGEHTTKQFLDYAWKCFQQLAASQKQDPVHFECSKQEFSQLWDELKHQLGFGDEDPNMHVDKVYPDVDEDNSGTICASEMIRGLIKHFIPRAERSYSSSRAPSSSRPPVTGRSAASLPRRTDTGSASHCTPRSRTLLPPGSPSTTRANPVDARLLVRIRDEPWCRIAEEEFESIGDSVIDSGSFNAIVSRLFEKKRVPVPSAQALETMFRIFDTNGDQELTKTEFLCGMWRALAFADAAAASCDDHEDEDDEQGGEWEGDFKQYLRLAVVPFSQKSILDVERLREMFIAMLRLQCTEQQGSVWRPSSALVSLFKRHKDILSGLQEMNYEIDEEHQHVMREISQPGKPVDLVSMTEKVSICSFGLAFEMIFKGLGVNEEIDFAGVCASQCPVSTVMDAFFESQKPQDTFLIRQVMREYLGSDEMLSANDRSYLLRLKNARSASRVSSSVGPSHSRTALLPSTLSRSPPVNPRESPRSQDLQATQLSNKRPNLGSSAEAQIPATRMLSERRFHVANRKSPIVPVNGNDDEEEEEEEDDDEEEDGDGGDDDDSDDDDGEEDEDDEQ